MTFTKEQTQQLLRPIHKSRVLTDGKGHSHVSQQDVLAHLIRVFGFGSFDIDVLNAEMVYEQPRDDQGRRFDVCYRAMVRLTIRDPDGKQVCHYENGSTATAQNQTRGDAHDLAYKSAISLSVKRAAIALGDQFGLSLYNKGQTEALVIRTLVMPDLAPDSDGVDAQDGVPQQVALGNDEIEREEPEPEKPRPAKVSDLDAAEAERRKVPVEQVRAERLEQQKVRRDAEGTDSSGKTARAERGRVERTVGRPAGDDPWAGRANPIQGDPAYDDDATLL